MPRSLQPIFTKPFLYAISIIIIALILAYTLNEYLQSQRKLQSEHTASMIGSRIVQDIQMQIGRGIAVTDILSNLLKYNKFDTSPFQSWAQEIAQNQMVISGLQFAKDGVISNVYPYEEHKETIGHNLFLDQTRTKGAQAAVIDRKLTFVGPIKLIGKDKYAVVARKPIFQQVDGFEEFWGFSTVIFYVEDLIKINKINILEYGFDYCLSGDNPDAEERPVFLESSPKLGKEKIHFPIQVPNGTWDLTLAYERGYNLTNYLIYLFFFISGLLAAWIVYRYECRIETKKASLTQALEELQHAHALQEKMLVQQSKMADMGHMLSVITHQWKQPLTILGLVSDSLNMEMEFDKLRPNSLKDGLEQIKKQVRHMNETADDFSSFFKPTKEIKPFEAVEAIREVQKFLEHQFYLLNISIHFELNSPITVTGNRNEFKQVIINILQNAKDVFEEKKIKDGNIYIHVEKSNTTGIIKIRDDGGKIPEEILDKLFNAYFTTKGEKGTGIGLQIVKLIIEKNMKGKIYAHNVDDCAEFVIELPCSNTNLQ